tara:strand:- start:473 stop:841 length:369 start_codon:yes stop_codon:yes gene_type:complete
MGYRSDVAAVIYADDGDTVEVIREKYAVLKVLMNTRFKEQNDFDGFTWNDRLMRLEFRVDNIKWYEGYPEVDGFMDMLEALTKLGYSYEYLRVGEEPDDIDREGNGCNGVLGVTNPQIEWDE